MGLREGYGDTIRSHEEVLEFLRSYITDFAVSVQRTDYIYPGGSEPGIVVGLMNYARFPQDPKQLFKHAESLAEALKARFNQRRVSVVDPTRSLLIGPTEDH